MTIMRFKISIKIEGSCLVKERICTKLNLLRTAELDLKLPQKDITSLIAFMATSRLGDEMELSCGRLYRIDDE